jgi:hypothetical protein
MSIFGPTSREAIARNFAHACSQARLRLVRDTDNGLRWLAKNPSSKELYQKRQLVMAVSSQNGG